MRFPYAGIQRSILSLKRCTLPSQTNLFSKKAPNLVTRIFAWNTIRKFSLQFLLMQKILRLEFSFRGMSRVSREEIQSASSSTLMMDRESSTLQTRWGATTTQTEKCAPTFLSLKTALSASLTCLWFLPMTIFLSRIFTKASRSRSFLSSRLTSRKSSLGLSRNQ